MFVVTMKLNRQMFFVCCAMILALLGITISAAVSRPAAVSAAAMIVKSNEDRISFLSGFGWTVDSEPYEVMEVVIPREFDEVYKKYNELQEEQGYDLHDYCGTRLKRWTYQITNYPGRTDDTIFANIYVYEDQVVAGDVTCTSLMGFMHGLSYTAQEQTQAG